MEGDGVDCCNGSLEACICGEAETCWECSKAASGLDALSILAMVLFIVLSLSESSEKGLAGTDGVYKFKLF